METSLKAQLRDAIILLRSHGFVVGRSIEAAPAPTLAKPPEQPSATKQRKAKVCSLCHQPGHNRRTCPQRPGAAQAATKPSAQTPTTPATVPGLAAFAGLFPALAATPAPTPVVQTTPTTPAQSKPAPAPVPTPTPTFTLPSLPGLGSVEVPAPAPVVQAKTATSEDPFGDDALGDLLDAADVWGQ